MTYHTNSTAVEALREQFDAWVRQEALKRGGGHNFHSGYFEAAWDGWQAHATLAAPTAAQSDEQREIQLLRAVYENARTILRYIGIDPDRVTEALDELDANVEAVKNFDGGDDDANEAAPTAEPPLTNLVVAAIDGYKAGLAGEPLGFVSEAFDCGWASGDHERRSLLFCVRADAAPTAEPARDWLAFAQAVADHFVDTDAPLGIQARALIAKGRP